MKMVKGIAKKVVRMVGFLSGLGVIIIISSILINGGESVYDSIAVNQKKNEISKEDKNSIDVMFIGDSLTYNSFSPVQIWEEYGYTSLCLGTSSQRLCDTDAILKAALKNQTPKVVVLEPIVCTEVLNKRVDKRIKF